MAIDSAGAYPAEIEKSNIIGSSMIHHVHYTAHISSSTISLFTSYTGPEVTHQIDNMEVP